MSDLENQQSQTEEQPLFNDKQLEYITSLLKQTKEEANKAVNAIDKRGKAEIAALQSTIEELRQAKAQTPSPETQTEQVEARETDTQPNKPNNTVSAVRKELEERLATERSEWQREIEAIKAERDAEKQAAKEQQQAAFKANLRKEVYKQLTSNGFEDIDEAMDFLFLKHNESKFEKGEEGLLIFKANEEESHTLEDVINKFKETPGGRRFLPAPTQPQGAGLPKSGNNTNSNIQNKPKSANDKLQDKLNKLKSGKAVFGV